MNNLYSTVRYRKRARL